MRVILATIVLGTIGLASGCAAVNAVCGAKTSNVPRLSSDVLPLARVILRPEAKYKYVFIACASGRYEVAFLPVEGEAALQTAAKLIMILSSDGECISSGQVLVGNECERTALLQRSATPSISLLDYMNDLHDNVPTVHYAQDGISVTIDPVSYGGGRCGAAPGFTAKNGRQYFLSIVVEGVSPELAPESAMLVIKKESGKRA
jgi:hypothetical protein